MEKHEKVTDDFLRFMNKRTNNFILKGRTSLHKCYGLDRISENINLDATEEDIFEIVDDFCKEKNYKYCIVKNTIIIKRCIIDYGNDNRFLEIETSYRRKIILPQEVTNIDGITVYTIERIALMKANAYASRDKIQDLYDILFICNNYFDDLSVVTKNFITDVVGYKGIEQFDYLVKTQSDPLIDVNKLETDFLKIYNKLGLRNDNLVDLSPDAKIKNK